ncbi:polysaccharide deacetylase [Colletotrichum musicola]|uniref:Polysaccharide deacetylase n=1 Tax=Colletotrichum musicola TaxID=2175873 RepID=A0A8H6KKU2_9PEZI|nr:polysaccharide deacetylase [Colletotrichum musicola]
MHFSKATLLGAAAASIANASSSTSPLARRASPEVGVSLSSCTQPGLVALTYDDGPFSYTKQLLDILDTKGVKATFFVNGKNWGNIAEGDGPALINRMKASGHLVGSHTNTHPDLDSLSSADRVAQMTDLETTIRGIAGFAPKYMRPPFLNCGPDCLADMKGLGYVVVGTNLDTKDYLNDTPDTTSISATKFDTELSADVATKSYIVLSHDVHEQTVVSLTGKMIDTLQARGYRAVTVAECLGEGNAANWYKA